jgi:predicted RND superfamily exporter protein
MNPARWIARLASAHGVAVLGVTALLTLPLAVGYALLGFTNDPEVIALQGSDELAYYRGFLRRWGSDELIVIAYPVEDAFASDSLAQLRDMTDALFEVDGVKWVSSLDTAFSVDEGPFGPFARPLIPEEASDAAALRKQALEMPLVAGSLVARDAKALLLAVQLEGTELDNAQIEARALAGIDAVLARPEFRNLDVHLAGSPVFNRELSELNQRDNLRFTPLAVGIIAALVTLLFRSALPTLLTLGTIVLSLVWTLGSMGLARIPLNITTSLLPPLILVIAVADSIHLLSVYIDRLRAGEARAAALESTLHDVLPACFFTSLTTALGFLTLLFIQIESVRSFALFAALGEAIAFAHSVIVLPALLVRLPLERSVRREPTFSLDFVASAAERPILATALLAGMLALGASGIGRVEVATHDGEFFSADNRINRAYRFIEARFEGATPFEVEVRGPTPGALRAGDGVRRLRELQQKMELRPELSAGASLPDLLLAANPGLDLADDAAVERALFLLGAVAPGEMERFVQDDAALARISSRAVAMSSAQSERLIRELSADAASIFPEPWSVHFTGLVPVFSRMEQVLVEGQLASYGSAALAVALLFWLIYPSLPITAVALLVNIAPLFAIAGLMGWLGIRLDVATVMVASVTLGMIVDDTIHMLLAFRHGLAESGDPRAALRHGLAVAGRPMVFTSLVLSTGFSSLLLSDFQPTAHFGLLVGVAVASAMAADLFMLPAALLLCTRARSRTPLQLRTPSTTTGGAE